MSDKSGGGKQKPQEKSEKTNDKSSNGTSESSRSNLSESGSSEKVSAVSKFDPKARAFERKTSPRPPPKGRGIFKNGAAKSRREDERGFNVNAKSFRRLEPKTSSSTSPSPLPNIQVQSEKKALEAGKAFTDESRLSKVIRRLLREADRDRRLTAARQLKDYLHTLEGGKAAVKCTDDLLATLQGIFFERGYRDVKLEVAQCMGAVGSAMGQDMQGFFQWLFGQTEAVFEDEIKSYYLLALCETLRCDEKRQNAAELMQLVMENIQTLLENADTPDLLIAVVDVIMFIAKAYPHVFSMHFRDTVDILVGWHIDATQKETLIRYTSQALVSFHMFWTSDLTFSLTLLGQFLEDMEAYAEDLNLNVTVVQPLNEEDVPSMEECITKISALLRVFTTVIQSLGDSFSPTKGGQISKEYVYEVLEKIVRSVENATKSVHSETIFISANACLMAIATQLQNNISPNCEVILPFVERQLFLTRILSKHLLISLFDLLHKVVEVFGPQLPVTFLTKVLGPGSLLHSCIMSHSGEVLGHLMSVYHAIFGLKSVPLLEESYRLIRSSVEACYTTLMSGSKSPHLFDNQEENPFSSVEFSIRQAEAVILFDVCALAEIGNTKSNLIGMWALSPSVFDLLSGHLKPTEPWIAECYPSVQYAVVYTLYSHCCRHGNFTSSSSMLTQPSPVDSAIISSVSMVTSGHFAKILELTEQLLAQPKTTFDVRCLVVKWVSEIITGLHATPHIFLKKIVVTLIKTLIGQGFNSEHPIFMATNHCLLNLFKSTVQFPKEVVKQCVELCAFRLTDHRRPVRDAYNALLKILPLDVVTSNLMFEAEEEALASQRRDSVTGLKAAWLARRNHICRQPLGTFHSHNFRHVMAFLLNNVPPSQQGILHWLEAMYHSAQRSDKESEKHADIVSLSDMIDGNESMLWFWATWESANFCVLARLRTPLGKPQETFMTIESVLKTMAAQVTKEESEDGGADTTKSERPGEYANLLRVHLLLQFMEHLEKLLYNAYEGCAVAMPTPPKTVRTFFRTNRNTCQEWIARIRICIIKIAVHAGMSATAARQAFELLKDMVEADNTQVPEFEQAVVYLIQALSDLRSSESVMGVYNWCREVAGRKFAWIKSAAEKAQLRYESAAREFKLVLKTLMSQESEEEGLARSSSSSPEGSPRPGSENRPLKKMILSKQPEKNPGTVSFIVNEVMDSYIQLSDWDSVMDWQEMVQKYRSENTFSSMQKAFNCTYDINYIKALSHFDSGNLSGVRESLELVPGASMSEINKSELSTGTGNPQSEVDNIHLQFIKAATLLQEHKQTNHRTDVMKCLSQAERLGEGLLKVEAMDWPPALSGQILTELNTVSILRKQLDEKRAKISLLPLSEQLLVEGDSQDVGTYMQTLRLLNLQLMLPGCDRKTELRSQLSRTLLAAASLSRKQHSYELAEDLLVRQVITMMRNSNENGRVSFPNDLVPALSSLRTCSSGLNQIEVMKVERESAKLLHSISQPKDAIDVMSSSIVGNILLGDAQSKKAVVGSCAELCSRSLLTTVKWLQGEQKLLYGLANQVKSSGQGDGAGMSHMVRNIKMLMEMEEKGAKKKLGLLVEDQEQVLKIGDNPILSDSDSIVGRLLHLGAMESPKLAKSWFTLAGWCYKWGRKAVDNASHGSVELSTEEKSKILSIIPKGSSNEETERILSVLSQIHSPLSSEEDISDQDQSLYDDGTETTRRQLMVASTTLQGASEECIDQLLVVWQGVVQRVYHYYKLSAKAYFTYLQLNGVNEENDNADWNIISTLRLLRLLVKHAWELRGVLENGLALTHTTPWKGIIPQLFSRLSHPEGYVRQSVSDLLCRVAQDAAHLIVYPAVVGSSANKMEAKVNDQRGLISNYLAEEENRRPENAPSPEVDEEDDEDEEEEETVVEDPSATMLQTCLSVIVDSLSHHNPKMISEVQQMVQELRRITLLWDELWLGTLNQQHTDVVRSLAQMDNEIKKVTGNQSLNKEEKSAIIREKHKTIMKPILYTMERLHEITSQTAETPHEKWFQDTYGELIVNALQRLGNPSNPSNPSHNWQLFKQLHVSLQQRAQKRNSLQLRMEEISPHLSSLLESVIPMPGLGVSGQVVTINSVYNTAQILPTKTKPKKLVLLGSDGKRYPYLFKGLEDLHLDERIMQFLSIVNNMFTKSNKGNRQLYRARHYSVTPLGPRSGLIQWVEGATPLFALYKKWQQREAIAQTLKLSTSGQGNVNSTTTIPRPSEIYYNKLTPALKDKGIENLESRKEWPLSVLKKVLEELMEETPKDLLARELWCASTGSNEWWQITQTYARSTAVMSMIGYIIGLGDRHLDNVLVDLATGEVVHIDYNVCFEKGKGLRVPERVPFRMTQNIETALGVTGMEGTFRTASENVMKTMRKGRETLLTLLEAFVYDPLVDWTTGNEGGYTGAFYGGGMSTAIGAGEKKKTKKEMEREITCSMFSIRIVEMKAAWTQNREDILSALSELREAETSWVERWEEQAQQSEEVAGLVEVKQLLTEAKQDPKHPLYSLQSRYEEYSIIKATKDSAFKAVEEKINDFSHWHKMHKQCLETIQGPVFQKMCSEVAKPLNLGAPSFSAATEFLQGAGQSQVVSQCEQLESEMSGHLQQRRSLLHTVFEVLHSYSTIVSQFGSVFANEARTSRYLWWLQDLVCDFTTAKCAEVTSNYDELFGPGSTTHGNKTSVALAIEAKLQTIITETNSKVIKLLERRALEPMDTQSLEIQYRDAERSIKAFVQESGMSGVTSLICVIVSALCSLNKRCIMMEGAASGAGDRLMDLTSRDGDWFLDELASMSGNVSMFLDTLKNNTMAGDVENFRELHYALNSTHNAYVALQDLMINFKTIILPETVKLRQAEDESLLSLLSHMETLVGQVKQPIDSLIAQLEVLHRNTVMGIENESPDCVGVVKKLQEDFMSLLQGPDSDSVDLSPGQMLIMGFNGLFIRLENEFATMLEAIDSVQVPDVWRKVDVVREAKSMQLSSFTSNTRGLLSSIFFLKRLQAMQEFFNMVTQFAGALQDLDGVVCYDDEQLAKPIKKFIAEYVRKQVIGFPSQILGYIICVFIDTLGVNVTAEIELKDVGAESKVPLDDLCKKAVDQCLRNSQFQHVHLTQATSLTGAQDAAWRKHDLARRLDSNVSLMKTSLQRCQPQVARFQWLHEDLFTQAGRHPSQFVHPVRATVMSDMRKGMQSLHSQETTIAACEDQYSQQESSIAQRLRWAAGANPTLNFVLQQFEEASNRRKNSLESESKMVNDIVQLCQAILHFEALRTRTAEAVTSDTNFLTLINRCNECCMLLESSSSSVSELEIQLMTSRSPKEGETVSEAWLETTLGLVNKDLEEMDVQTEGIQDEINSLKSSIQEKVAAIKTVLASHHKLMSDLRSILKSMAKQEEQDYGDYIIEGGIREYLSMYKSFSENMAAALKTAVGEDMGKEMMLEARAMLVDLLNQVPDIYDSLTQFAPPLLVDTDEEEEENLPRTETGLSGPAAASKVLKKPEREGASPSRRMSNVQRDLMVNTPPFSPGQIGAVAAARAQSTPIMKKDRIARDPRTGKAIQERNTYAVGVWRRVKMKLDGRDPDPSKRMSVPEQVDYVLKEATHLDNLAVLYEGWTPWV